MFATRVLACVAVVVGVCAWGQEARIPQVKVTVQKTTGEPVSPHVNFVSVDPPPGGAQENSSPILPQGPIASHNTETQEFTYSGYPPGRYTISWYEGVEGLVSAMPPVTVDIKREGPPIVVVFKVRDGGVITGRVTDVGAHEPAVGIQVSASHVGGEGTSLSATTDADGRYRIVGALEGAYTVSVMQTPGTCYVPMKDAWERQAETAPGKTTEGVDFEMRKMPVLRGLVVDKDGKPVANKGVSALATNAEGQTLHASGGTGPDGRFEMVGLEPSDGVYLGFEQSRGIHAGPCAVPIGPFTLTEEGLDGLQIVTQEPAEVAGVVVDSEGNPLPGARVALESKQYKLWNFSTETDSAGAFVFGEVYSGEFAASAMVLPREKGSGLHFQTETPVACTVRPGEKVAGLKLTVPRDTGFIAGTVRDTAGKPIEGALLYVLRPHQDCLVGEPDTFATDKEGRYRITGLAANEWQVFVRDAAECYRPANRTPVAVGSTDVDFTLHEACFAEGRVVSEDTGQALPEFQVSLISSRYEDSIDRYGGGVPFKDAEGRFRLMLAFEETTDITLVAYGPGYAAGRVIIPEVSPDKPLTDIVVRVPRAGHVCGTVLDPDGKPKADVTILRGEYPVVHKWDLYYSVAQTGADGTFRTQDIMPGPQKLTAFCPDFAPVVVEVSPESGGSKTVEIRLLKGATLEGDLSLGGKPLDAETSVTLTVDPAGGPDSNRIACVASGTPHYVFDSSLTPGKVRVTADFRQDNNTVGLVGREVTLEDGKPAKVDFDLPVGACVMEGTVTAPEGVEHFRMEFTQNVPGGTAVTMRWGEPGAYRFDGLPEGGGEVSIKAWLQEKTKLVRTVPVQLVAGTPCRVDVDLR